MVKTTTTDGIAGLNRALRSLPKEASAKLRDASVDIAAGIAAEAQVRAYGIGRSYTLVAPTIKATRDRVPVVKMGGSAKLAGRKGDRQTVGDLVFGSEFGGQARPRTMQFLPHLGTTGYALWPVVRERSDDTGKRYSEALLTALEAI